MRSIGFLSFLCLAGCVAVFSQAPATAPGSAKAAPASTSCTIDTREATEGENALAKKDYKAAAIFYRAAIGTDGKSEEAHLGLTRALIGLDDTSGALAEANAMLTRNPSSALGELALADASYRTADFDAAYKHLQKGSALNSCEGRIFAGVSDIAGINALYARAAKLIAYAHRLRPNDEVIRRDWIESLPRKQRLEELTKYLASAHSLSEKDALGYGNQEQHLKARRAGECHVVSKAEKTRVPFQPIFGDGTILRPMAYGLDVSFNGKRRRMQIDSGASGIVLTKAAARALNLEPEFKIKTGGVGDDGEVDSYLTHVASIRIGDVEVTDCMVEVLGKSKLSSDGLIGSDVFDRWLVTLDYQNAQLLLGPLPARPGTQAEHGLNSLADGAPDGDDSGRPPMDRYIAPEMKDWLQVVRIGHAILLPAQIGKGAPRYLMADTGASRTVLALSAAREAGKVSEESDVHFKGISGEVKKTYRLDDAKLIFGRFVVPPTTYFAFDITSVSHAVGAEVSGFVGLPTLSRLTITIDYRDNLINMTYDPNHDVQRF